MKNTYLEAKSIINGKPFDEIVNLPKIDERFSYGTLNGSEGEGLVDLNFKDILVTVCNNNGVATIVSYEQYDANGQFTDLVHTNESKTKKNMKKNIVKLNESQLKKIVAESVKRVLKEVETGMDDYLSELSKGINYFYSEAMQNLKNLVKEYEQLPDEYSNMKQSNIAVVREAMESLKLAYSGKQWQETGPSLSMMANYPNVGDQQ